MQDFLVANLDLRANERERQMMLAEEKWMATDCLRRSSMRYQGGQVRQYTGMIWWPQAVTCRLQASSVTATMNGYWPCPCNSIISYILLVFIQEVYSVKLCFLCWLLVSFPLDTAAMMRLEVETGSMVDPGVTKTKILVLVCTFNITY